MIRKLATACAAFCLPVLSVHAQSLLDETSVIVAPTAPSAVLREFAVTSAGTYELTLSDFGVPAALTGERAAVLRDGVIVRLLELDTADTASATFDATAGNYSLSIVANPGAPGIGTVGARIRRGTDTPVLDVTETISIPNPPPAPTHQVLDTTFTVTDAAQYRVSLTDLGFPQALASVQLAVVPEGGAPVATLAAAGQATFNANPGNYRLFVIADADTAAGAGLYFAEVRGVTSGAAIYQRMLTVGHVTQLGGTLLPAGLHRLTGTDLALPTPLAALKLAVTSQGQLVTRLDSAGSVDFTAAAAGHELLAAAAPAAASSGSFTADLSRGATQVASFVSSASDGDSAGASTFTGLVATAGVYRLRLTDFAFPQGFTSLRAVVTQNGSIVASISTTGNMDVTLAAGTVNVLVFGQANTSANGIYGIELRPATGTGNAVIEGTRGVGTAFGAWPFTVSSAGRYQVIADDLEFPARFAGLDAVVTRGPDVIGSFFGGGSFIFSATPGNYFINFIARPGATSGGAGTFRVRVATAPSLPAVTLNADSTRVNAGSSTRLTWSATNATQCTASGAWSGSKAATGSETTAALSTESTFNLECVGPGGSSSAQLVVNVNAPNAGGGGGGGGGGRLSETFLLALLAAAALRVVRSRAPQRLRR
jgi:hypothetical protein